MAAGEAPELPGVTHRYVDVGGLRVHVAEAGRGEPLVLQHGWPQNWWAWRFLIPPLAERYRVIAPDLRGLGWSDAPPAHYEKEQLATDLLGVMDALGLERVRLAGHDWGGFAGFLACVRAPERFSRFMSMSILHPWPPPERPSPSQLAKAWYQVLMATPGLGQQVVQRMGFVPRALVASRKVGEWTPEELEVYGERFRDPARARGTVLLYRTFLTRELRPIIAGLYNGRRLTVPTQLVVGAEDDLLKNNPLTGYEQDADDMTIDRIPGVGHWMLDEAPDEVLPRMLAFFGDPR
jgi:pimeloyl-ACP methyl ester carboxylesterase